MEATLRDIIKSKLTVASGQLMTSGLSQLNGFDKTVCQHLTVTSAHNGRVECELTVSKDLTNVYGGLHGGASATLVDHCGTLALMSLKPTHPGLSIEISATYLNVAKVGDKLRVVAQALKVGRTIAVADVTIRRADDDVIVAVGKHTKHIGA